MAKVLIIDSEPAAAQALRAALQAQGIESEITADGNDGLTLARSYEPTCIVLCVELPRVSGYSICNKLKKDPALSAIPLVLVSSQATEETFEQHKKLKTRAEGYVRRPYEMDTLMAVLREFVPMREPTQSKVTKAPVLAQPKSDEFSLEDLGLEDAPKPSKAPSPPASAPAAKAAPRRPTVESLGLEGLDTEDEAPKKPAPTAFDLDDDDSSALTRTGVVQAKPVVSQEITAGRAKVPTAFDLDEDLESEAPAPAPIKAQQRAAAPAVEVETPFEDEVPTPAPRRAAAAPPKEEVEDDGLPSFDDEVPARPAAAVAAPAAPARALDAGFDDSDAPQTRVAMRAPLPSIDDDEFAVPAPKARPAVRPVVKAEAETPAPVETVKVVHAPDPQAENLRTENKQLRQKLQQLEQTLQEKELEFNDRLLQESSRSRESVDLKKKISGLERDVAKHQQAADAQSDELARALERAKQAEESGATAEAERQALLDKTSQLLEKLKAVSGERQALQDEITALRESAENLQREQEMTLKTRAKAKKAVDIALQLLEETGLLQAPPAS